MRDEMSNSNSGAVPRLMPSAAAAAAGPITTPDVNIEGFEISQAIQNMAHAVPLLAGKATVVRAYIGTNDPSPWTLDGAIEIRPVNAGGTAGPWTLVNSISSVGVNPAENGQLRLKRESIQKSMNFRFPETLLGASKYDVRLVYIYPVGEFERRRYVVARPECNRSIALIATPPLRIHVVGIRYEIGAPPAAHTPTPRDFAMLRSWLIRAYPVSDVFWTETIVNFPNPWTNQASDVNAFVSALRTVDVSNGTDQRTHYYGFVHDGGGFMRGLADSLPATPDPSVVASGPTGNGSFGWDTDGSYGDWYGGHELAHTLGRPHAPFCGAGGGAPYPHPAGQLSTNDGAWVGLDVGDAANGIAMQALPGVMYHDVMTYCEFQWLSDFTYNAIRDRLVAEDALPAGGPTPGGGPGAGAGAAMATQPNIHIFAEINLTKKTGRFQQVNPVSAAPSAGAAPAGTKTYIVRTLKADGTTLKDYKVALRLHECRNAGDDETGSVETVIPGHADIAALVLLDGTTQLDKFEAGSAPAAPANVQSAAATATAAAAASSASQARDPVITWQGGSAAAAAAAAVSAKPTTYMVQLSTDDGKTWRAIGLGLKSPQIELDRRLISGAQSVQIKVTATNGLRSESSVKTFKASEL